MQYGFADFWASPLQTMESEAGDCEDYAIVKYARLADAWSFARRSSPCIVQDEKRETGHAVVAVRRTALAGLGQSTMAILNAEDVPGLSSLVRP